MSALTFFLFVPAAALSAVHEAPPPPEAVILAQSRPEIRIFHSHNLQDAPPLIPHIGEMPVVKPDPRIDYKLLVALPDPDIDYKLRIIE